MNNIKYVFIGLDNIENRYLYSGYRKYADSTAVFLPNKIRLAAKAARLYGLSDNALSKGVLDAYFSSYIGRHIKKLGWSKTEEFCFIVYARDYESYGDVLIDYLRDTYPASKITIYFVDRITDHKLELDHVKNTFDAVFTWDEKEAEKYDMNWSMEPFSTVLLDRLERDLPMKWDVALVASAKDRFPQIIELYEQLRSRGFICDFHVIRVPKNERKYIGEIDYAPLSFEELLKHVIQSKCTIELLQGETTSPTTRFSETVLLNRRLLSNARYFKYRQEEHNNVVYFEDIKDIPFDLLTKPVYVNVGKYRKILSNRRMIKDIHNGVYGKDAEQ